MQQLQTERRLLTSMAAEDLLVDDSSNGEAVKAVGEGLPQFDVEPALAWKSGKHLVSVSDGNSGTVCSDT